MEVDTSVKCSRQVGTGYRMGRRHRRRNYQRTIRITPKYRKSNSQSLWCIPPTFIQILEETLKQIQCTIFKAETDDDTIMWADECKEVALTWPWFSQCCDGEGKAPADVSLTELVPFRGWTNSATNHPHPVFPDKYNLPLGGVTCPDSHWSTTPWRASHHPCTPKQRGTAQRGGSLSWTLCKSGPSSSSLFAGGRIRHNRTAPISASRKEIEINYFQFTYN